MKITRKFTQPGRDPLADIPFEPRTSKIANPDGRVVFEMTGVMVPAHWSQVATDVLAQKYFRKAGVPKHLTTVEEDGVPAWLCRSVADDALLAHGVENPRGPETDSRQVFRRLAGCWTYWGWKGGYFDKAADQLLVEMTEPMRADVRRLAPKVREFMEDMEVACDAA